MKIKTSQLSSPDLDWAVGLAVHSTRWETIHKEWYWYPSVDWRLTGPLMEKYITCLLSPEPNGAGVYGQWHANIGRLSGDGDTPLEAICRAIVASELGDEVDVPDELGGGE